MAILMPRQDCKIYITVQGVQHTRPIELTGSYPDNHCLSFVGIQALRRDFHRSGVNALSMMSQVVRLATFETGFVQKKWSESRIAGRGGPLRVNPYKHYVNEENFGTKVVRDARWSAY